MITMKEASELLRHGMQSTITTLGKCYPKVISEGAVRYFAIAQGAQDDGSSWGEALALAEEQRMTWWK